MNASHPRRWAARTSALGAATLTVLVTAFCGAVAPARADTTPPAGTPATVTADILPTWQLNGVVWSEVTVGYTVYVTGSFTKARPPGVAAGGAGEIAANNIFAFNITTGNPVSGFNHSLDAQGIVITASPDGSRVYVGGDFTHVDGAVRDRLAAFDTATNALDTSFQPNLNARVAALTATNATVYAGGNFSTANSLSRSRLAAFVPATGATTSWAPAADDSVTAMVLTPDGTKVAVGGHFTHLNSVAAYGMGAVSTSSGATQTWLANTTIQDAGSNGAILSLRADASQIYGTGYAFGSGASWEGSFALNPANGAINWLNDCHGDTYDVLPVGQVVYTVSHAHDCSAIHQFPETNPRTWHHALAFTTYPTGTNSGPDAYGWNFNGKPDSMMLQWYPTLADGTYTGQDQAAWALTGNSQFVVLGGEFPTVNGVAQSDLVRFGVSSVAPHAVAPQSSTKATVTTAGTGSLKVSWTSTWDMDNQNLTYKVYRDGSTTLVNTQTVASNFWTLPADSFTDTGLTSGSSHYYLVRVSDPNGNARWSTASSTVTVP